VSNAITEKQLSEAQPTERQRRDSEAVSDVPPGWSYNPSSWRQRMPIIAIALVNGALAAYLAACEMGFVRHAWDPLFGTGTDRVLNSSISRAFPVPDAALGAGLYLLEALFSIVGDRRRWKSKPWLALTFGIVIAPLFIVTLVLLVLQPVAVHAWCTLCLIIAAGMLLLVPLALDEVIAAMQFLVQSARDGRPFWETLWGGEESHSDGGDRSADEAESGPFQGFSVPWNLAVCAALGIWLMACPVVLRIRGESSVSCEVTGALIIAIATLACAEPLRPIRFAGVACGIWLLIFSPWTFPAVSPVTYANELLVGIAVILCSAPRGRIRDRFGSWDRYLV